MTRATRAQTPGPRPAPTWMAGVLKYAAPGESCFEDGRLSIAPAVANLLTCSENFDNGTWTKLDASISANAISAPDGTITAGKLIEAATSAVHPVLRDVSGLSDDTAYTFSVFAKAGERSWLSLQFRNKANNYFIAYFDLSTASIGTVQGGASAVINALDNGWYRCSIALTSGSGATTPRCLLYPSTGDLGANYTAMAPAVCISGARN